jgi:hypothetical protein
MATLNVDQFEGTPGGLQHYWYEDVDLTQDWDTGVIQVPELFRLAITWDEGDTVTGGPPTLTAYAILNPGDNTDRAPLYLSGGTFATATGYNFTESALLWASHASNAIAPGEHVTTGRGRKVLVDCLANGTSAGTAKTLCVSIFPVPLR